MDSWQPAEQATHEICSLLHEYLLPGVDQSKIWEQLQRCNQFPDFNNYLAFILSRGEGQPVEVRQAAGLVLKNNMKQAEYGNLPLAFQQYVKSQLLLSIGTPDRQLRATVGTVISAILTQSGLGGWPEILTVFLQCLESNDYNHMEGAMDALSKVCEDTPELLDADIPGLKERPIDVFLPRFLMLFSSPHTSLRRLSLSSVNQFILPFPRALLVNMDNYLKGIFALATDQDPEIRKLVCAAIVQLVEVQPDFLQPHINDVIAYMLHATQDSDSDVALEACEFWSAFCEAQLPMEYLAGIMPQLIEILLVNMAYADDDEALLEAQEDENAPDRDQDLKPRFHKAKVHGSESGQLDGAAMGAQEDGGDYDGDDDDDSVSVWNLRKCSAAGLDMLSTHLGDTMLTLLMPKVQSRLSLPGDAAWKARESGVLAVGAVAEGCLQGLTPVLPTLVAFLLPLLQDRHPLVRSITCWTLSRFSAWLSERCGASSEGQAQFDAVLTALLQAVLDSNKKVQEAACSAFATLEEEAGEEVLLPRLQPVLQHLMYAFGKYQRANLRILYDAIGTLADCVGDALAQPAHVDLLMPPLIAKWSALRDSDKDLFPLLECLTSIAQAMGPAFAPFAPPVLQRCQAIIAAQLALRQAGRAGQPGSGGVYDKEFVVCCLDLLSGMAEGMGAAMEPLLLQQASAGGGAGGPTDLPSLLLQCCGDDEAHDVRQSAMALLGDLAKSCMVHLQPRLHDFLTLATQQLSGPHALSKDRLSVANNACWAIGEIAVKVKGDMAPYVLPVITCLVPILTTSAAAAAGSSTGSAQPGSGSSGSPSALVENAAITLGRLAWACPQAVAPHMEHFMDHWCKALRMIRDGLEKEDAFRGLCAMIRLNPQAGALCLRGICQAVGSWLEIRSQDVRADVTQVLQAYKQMLSNGPWEQCMASLEPALKEKLTIKYGL